MNVIATTPRATRYDLRTRVVYRREGDEAWQEGQAVNVSRTGLLFRPSAEGLLPATAIEFVLELPSPGIHRHPARVQCRGRVARCCQEAFTPAAVAATIDTYRFLDPATAGG
ncbi:MAG: PilZ domain-containing protein [Acidobacteria bacterium]|nr:MAG: PilZ domain-containing protein [Acidobacteriota bacterium]